MKRIIMFCCLMATFIFLFWNLDSTANAQNLVPNPSFESGTVPTDISTTHYLSQVNKATGWGSPNLASPDLFDSLINTFCEDVNGGSAGVPYNWWNQKVAGTPCPSTTTDYGNTPSYHGSRYAGIIAYFDSSSTPGTDYREYLQVQLSSALVAGNTYNVSFYVRLGNRCKYALQELGAWFSPTQVNIGNFSPILQTEHVVHNSGLLTSINSWQKVSGTYTPSSSGEQYMLIGNFRANSHTTKQTQGGLAALHNSAYYYIDSISVIARDSCDEDTLSLNTGFDHCTGSVYSAPGFDNYWRVIGEPPAATAQFNPSNPPSPTNPRPASVRSAHDAWDGPLSNSQWISSHPVNEVHHNGDYTYRFKFCMEDTSGNPNLWLELLVDDAADVYLNTFPIGSTPANPSGCTSPSIGGCNFRYPTHIISTNDKSLFVSGTTPNILDVVVHNQHGRALGLNIQGYVSGTGVTLEKMECCNDSGAICGYKWFDDNGDGIWQQGTESGIGNWPINLSNGKTVYTDNFGFYFFPNVATGSYQVSEGNPGFGCTQTSTPTIHNVTVSANQIVQNINFGNQCDSVGILCITKFNDTDRDGEKDPGELGIEDWPVSVNGILSTSGFTNSDGQLCVKVIAGTYTVSEFLDEDWLPTTAYTQTVQVNLGQTVEVLFGNFYCPGSDSLILNTGWDQDVGGTFSNAELDNEWYVFSDPDGNTTERRPAYVIPPYYPGNAWANPQTNSKWISSYPTADDDLNGHYVFEYYFCLEDSEDAMLCLNLRADDTASVYLNGNFINSTGTYSFKPYKNPVNMCTANPAFFKAGVNTIRVDVHNTHNVAMGFNLTGYVRGHIPRYWCCCSDSTGGIMGRKFNDLDGDGYWDTGEPTIPNWPIQLSNGQNTTTDIHGNYYFLFLKPGTYTVTEGSISGWVQTAPSSGSYTLTLDGCKIIDSVNFGNRERSCVPAPKGMAAWWKLDEGTGTSTVDDAGVPNNGTLINGPAWVSGKVNGALSFDGTNDYVQAANHSELDVDSNDFSIDAWIRTTDTSQVRTVLDKRTAGRGYSLYLYYGRLGFQLADGTHSNLTSSVFVADGQWHHIAITVDRDNPTGIIFYRDGVPLDSEDPTGRQGSLSNTGSFRLGITYDSNTPFKGALDEVEFFQRILSSGEIASLWSADSLGKCVTDSCLNFGKIDPCKCTCKTIAYDGTVSPTSCESGNESAGVLTFSVDPNSPIVITNVIPTVISNGGSTINLSTWTAGYSTSGIVGPFTPFDPQMGTTITAGASGDITIRFGATICPMKNIPTGLYTSTLYLTWKYSGSESSTMNEQIPLCISAEIIGKKCCVERPANMVAWWTLDETSGSVSDDVMGFPNDGTRINAPTVVAGKVVSALNFNGTTQYVEIPSHSEINLDSLDFTIDAWIKSVDSIGVSTMVDKRVSSPVQGFSFFLNNGKLALQLADATGTSDFCSFNSGDNCTNYSSQLSVADGQWHHIAVTVDRNDAQGIVFYKDGVASSTLYDPTYRDGSLSSNAVLHLGARSFDNSASYQGILDEVEIFKRALSATEILSIFLADSAGKCKPNNTLDDNIDVPIDRRWNLLSVPVIPPDYSATTLYPGASSMAFTYENGYNVASTLDNCSGFWLKFPEADTQKMIGRQLLTNYCRLESGWNIIGSLSGPVDVSTSEAIANLTTPTGIIISSVFGYSSGYNLVASIEPGKGYWVNASQSGTLNLESSFGYQKAGATITAGAYLSQLNKLTIKDASGSSQSLYFEKSKDENNSSSIFMLPPVPPEGVFDARFTSQRMVETYLNETGERKNLVISLHSVVYPLEVKIDVQKTLQERIVVGEIVNGLVVKTYILKNQQPILIQNSSVSALVLKVESTKPLPKEYALYQCYPNPFNPSTTISFDVPMNALVSLNVFDIIGREVATLVENQQYEVGNYELVFNAGNLASGMYFYRITAIGSDGKMFNEVKRMLLIK